ncbi:unnamed protein product [Diamesa serratosioi]
MNITKLLAIRQLNPVECSIKKLQAAPPFVERLDLQGELIGHDGCVNTLEFSNCGSLLASGSDDFTVHIWDPYRQKLLQQFKTPHRGNIFSVKFLPKSDNKKVVTGAADSHIFAFDLENTEIPIFKCRCHLNRVKRLATAPELPSNFFSGSEDGSVLHIDLREPHTCNQNDKIVLLDLKNHRKFVEIKSIAINPRRPEQLLVGVNDSYVRLFDRRMIKPIAIPDSWSRDDNFTKECVKFFAPGHLQAENSNKTVTFVSFNPDGTEILVNYGAEQIYLFDINNAENPTFLNLPKLPTEPLTKPDKDDKVEAIKVLGNEYLEKENYIEAIKQYTLAIKLNPNYSVLYLNRATALMRRKYLGDVYAALKDCQTALILDPHYIKAHFRMARALLELNQLTMSNECLQELKRRFASHVDNHGVMMLERDINEALLNRTVTGPEERSINKLSDNEIFWRADAKDFKERFIGHCNVKTDIKEANFFGRDGEYIAAGSDDGYLYLWERKTNSLVGVYSADKSIVNCVQTHPFLCMLATSGIDHEIRLWSPQSIEFPNTRKLEKLDSFVYENNQDMQNNSFEFETENVCRTS